MTRQENIELIRQKCVEANPDIKAPDQGGVFYIRPIRLADVLLVVGKANVPGFYVDRHGSIEAKGNHATGARWNLRQDDLTEQSDECVAFLAKLLA